MTKLAIGQGVAQAALEAGKQAAIEDGTGEERDSKKKKVIRKKAKKGDNSGKENISVVSQKTF